MWKPFNYSTYKGFRAGAQLDGARVAQIDSWGVRERGESLEVVVVLEDRRMARFRFARGEPITACAVSAWA